MKFSTFIVGTMLALSAMTSHAAPPAPITSTTTLVLTEHEGDSFAKFWDDFYKSDSTRAFMDTYLFKITSPSYVGISFSSPNSSVHNLTFDTFSLYASGGSSPLYSTSVSMGSNFDAGAITQTLGAGDYFFHIGGKITGTSGGSYSGTVNISPVPEPETWGMTLAGLATVGALVRRRKTRARKPV